MNECLMTPQHVKQIGYWVIPKMIFFTTITIKIMYLINDGKNTGHVVSWLRIKICDIKGGQRSDALVPARFLKSCILAAVKTG